MSDVKITDNSALVRAAMEGAKEKILTAWSIQGANNCANELENAPRRVDTGRLKNSINGKVQGNSAVIGTAVEYAPYVFYGTRNMEANRFLRNGVERNADEYRQIMESILKNTQI